MAKIKVQEKDITVVSLGGRDYISLTDMANAKESESRAADIINHRRACLALFLVQQNAYELNKTVPFLSL